mmetsp:Transcript_112502/g.195223  ORF Transcript_112502/g.195223 Transcript_112502/m.195223 type:complete len:352 (+) Transcript_112502:93-1148(+)
MDFDDLDEEMEKRVAEGEEVAGYVRENNQPRQGEELPLITRSNMIPGIDKLPDKNKKEVPPYNGQKATERKPVLRLLVAHGVCDSFPQAWHLFADSAPPEIEVAMHEFPGHGHREDEEILGDMDKLADDCYEGFKEAMDTGSFALLGHSIGCLIVTRVAARARKELGVEPVVVFMIERGAPPYGKWSDEGFRVLHEDKMEFMKVMQPMAADLYKTGTAIGNRTMDMWQRGWFMENATMEVGDHEFQCPIIAIYAERMVTNFIPADQVGEALKDDFQSKMIKWNALHQKDKDGRLFVGHFPIWTFEEWSKWTSHSGGVTVLNCRGTDHMSIKSDDSFKRMVFDYCKEVVKEW